MTTGVVKWFNDAKGYGFIEADGSTEEVFAHFSAIQMDGFKTLRQGMRVRFEQTDGPKGKQALNIQPEQPLRSEQRMRRSPYGLTGVRNDGQAAHSHSSASAHDRDGSA